MDRTKGRLFISFDALDGCAKGDRGKGKKSGVPLRKSADRCRSYVPLRKKDPHDIQKAMPIQQNPVRIGFIPVLTSLTIFGIQTDCGHCHDD